jgi:hypothetical protein
MKVVVIAARLVVVYFLIGSSPAFAQQRSALLTPAETKAYHACLFAAWVEDYCSANSWRLTASGDRVHSACVVANGGGRFPLHDSRHWYNTDDYCWSAARGRLR